MQLLKEDQPGDTKMDIKTIYAPEYKGAIEGYVINFLKSNFWRVSTHMEYEDILQESYVIFLKLKNKYDEIDTPQHFMSLFKTAWFNHFTDLSHKDTNLRCMVSSTNDEDGQLTDYIIGETDNEGALRMLIKQAPEEVRMVIQLFLNAPTELLELASTAWKDSGHNSDKGNGLLCKLLGFQEGTDVISIVKNYFSE